MNLEGVDRGACVPHCIDLSYSQKVWLTREIHTNDVIACAQDPNDGPVHPMARMHLNRNLFPNVRPGTIVEAEITVKEKV